MSIWIILSWVGVAVLTGINIFVFLKLKGASEQMMKMDFPGAKDMGQAMSQMQGMMSGMNRGGGSRAGNSFGGGGNRAPQLARGGGKNMDGQLKAAMDMLQKMQKPKK